MSKKLLIETRMNSLGLCESKETRSGCLGSLYGPCADYDRPTRNSNLYTRKLWENVFNDDIVKESLEDRILIGELDHPADRLETKAVNAAIVMTGYDFHDDEGLLYGSFDILNTPNGRILKSLLDYGCKIGVSSRGEGDVEEITQDSGDIVNKVDEDNYEFVGFDAVVLPAVKAAKPSLREGVDREQKTLTLKESLAQEVSSATTVAELDLIKKVVEATNLPDADSLLESVNNKSKELSSGSTGSSALMEDLEKSTGEVQRLNEEVGRLKGEITTCKSRYSKQIRLRQKLIDESVAQRKKLEDLNKKYSALVFESTSSSNRVKNLEEELSKSRSVIRGLKNDIRSTSSKVSDYESRINSLEESLTKSQSSCRGHLSKIKALTSQLEGLKNESSKKLTESVSKVNKLKENLNSVKSSLDEFRTSYVVESCKSLGIDHKKILESVKKDSTKSDIDKMIQEEVEKSERYKSLPFTQDSLIDLLESSTVKFNGAQIKSNDESERTYQFMEETSKLL